MCYLLINDLGEIRNSFQEGSDLKLQVVAALQYSDLGLTEESTWDDIISTLSDLYPEPIVIPFNCPGYYSGSDNSKQVYWSYSFGEAKSIKSMVLTLSYTHSSSVGNNMGFTLEGSNNNSSWVTLYSLSGGGAEGVETYISNNKTYSINTAGYLYYRMCITGRRSHTVNKFNGYITFS